MSERRAILEKVVAQADPNALSGKADMAVGMSEETSCSCCAGVVATACTQGKRAQHGKPCNVVGCEDQLSVITIIDVVKFTLFEGLAVLSVNHVTFRL